MRTRTATGVVVLTLVAGTMLAPGYMRSVATDEATIEAGTTYLLWFVPALALGPIVEHIQMMGIR